MGYGMGFPADGLENHGWRLYITSLVMIIASGLFVAARCATRIRASKFGRDDAAMLLSLAFSVSLSVCMQLAIKSGYGMHKRDLSKDELHTALKFFFIAQTPYKATVCLNKVAAILLYLRIFISRRFKICAYIVMAIIVAWSIGAIGATIWQCVPIAASWDRSITGTCIKRRRFWVAYAIMNILTDIMVLVLPIPSILHLRLCRRDKVMLIFVFLLGGFVTITSVLRTTSVHRSLKKDRDITWNFINRGIWTLIEANVGLISGCLIVLRQPLGRIFPSLFGSVAFRHGSKLYEQGDGKGQSYNLSGLSDEASHPGTWRESAKFERVVSISGPGGKGRRSDEEQIVAMMPGGSSTEAGSPTVPENLRGIFKRVDVTWSEHSSG